MKTTLFEVHTGKNAGSRALKLRGKTKSFDSAAMLYVVGLAIIYVDTLSSYKQVNNRKQTERLAHGKNTSSTMLATSVSLELGLSVFLCLKISKTLLPGFAEKKTNFPTLNLDYLLFYN